MPGGVRVQDLIAAHYEALYRYAYRLSGSAADADDLTQETFRKALTRLHTLREPDKAKGWLFRILRNAYLHRIRDQKREKLVAWDSVPEVAGNPDADQLPEVDSAELQKALASLDETFRTPVILYYFEDFSYRDIAEQMDLPIGTVMSRLARAKAHLKAKLSAPETAKVR
jgi:RNA polymerase sigma-70 factor, ECF subfamily